MIVIFLAITSKIPLGILILNRNLCMIVLFKGDSDMSEYQLRPDESLVMKSDRVLYGGVMSGYTNELVLTNKNIVLIKKGIMGKAKGIQHFPLNQVKVFDGKAQAISSKQQNGYPQLEVYLINSQEKFGFESKREVEKWVTSINQLLTVGSVSTNDAAKYAIPGTEVLADTLKGTVDTFKNAFGVRSSKKANSSVDSHGSIAGKCTSCGAPISGIKGQLVTCQYCDTSQQL